MKGKTRVYAIGAGVAIAIGVLIWLSDSINRAQVLGALGSNKHACFAIWADTFNDPDNTQLTGRATQLGDALYVQARGPNAYGALVKDELKCVLVDGKVDEAETISARIRGY